MNILCPSRAGPEVAQESIRSNLPLQLTARKGRPLGRRIQGINWSWWHFYSSLKRCISDRWNPPSSHDHRVASACSQGICHWVICRAPAGTSGAFVKARKRCPSCWLMQPHVRTHDLASGLGAGCQHPLQPWLEALHNSTRDPGYFSRSDDECALLSLKSMNRMVNRCDWHLASNDARAEVVNNINSNRVSDMRILLWYFG